MRRAWRYCLLVFVALRIGVSLLGAIGVSVLPQRALVSVPGWADNSYVAGAHNLVTSMERQDALWFLRIADDGYRTDDASAAFFPGYPIVVRGASWAIGGRPLLAGFLVSNLSFLLALVLLYDLSRREYSEETARRTVLYLAVFPTAFFFMAPYSESLFLLLAVASFRQSRLGRWPTSAAAGIGAAATRSLGIVLAPALAVEAFQQCREERADPGRSRLGVALCCACAIPIGLVAYLVFWKFRTGDALAPLRFQSNWLREPMFPLETLWRAVGAAMHDGSYWLIDVLVVLPCLGLAVLVAMRARLSYTLYTWLGILLPMALVWPGRPLMSMPRFMVVLFPLFWMLADLTQRRRIPHTLVIAVSSAGLGLLTVLFATNYFIF